jgi:NitT/TauT family transport system permease protein
VSGTAPMAVQPIPRGGMARLVGRRALDWVPALVFLVLVIGLWQGLVVAFHVQRFLLPKPSEIATTFWDNKHDLWSAGWFTFQEALGGFALGSGLAIVFALVLARWRFLGNALMPYAIAANAIPIIAFAPITNNWFGILSPASKMAIAAVLVFFPVLINTIRGLTSVRPGQIELMRSYAAGELQIFRLVRVPAALPFIFSGLKVGTVLAMIGAIVGDYFGGSQDALGILIRRSAGIFDFELAWAAIVVASILGMLFYASVAVVERVALRSQAMRGADL